MPVHLPVSLSFPGTGPAEAQSRPVCLNFPEIPLLSAFVMSGNLSWRLRRLIITSIVVIIFLLVPFHDGTAEMNQPVTQPPTVETASFERRESVLERFRNYSGEKTRAALESLFMRQDPAFLQDPAVILSDGVAVAGITLQLSVREGESPKFAVSGGQCIAARMTGRGVWILEILPNRGSLATSITVLSEGKMVEYPLTVAPPLHLFDPRNAQAAVIDYVATANTLASPRAASERK